MKKKFEHVCITTGDMQKSLDFYKNAMGLEAVHETDEWSELKLNNDVNLALWAVADKKDAGFGFQVEDCKKATDELLEKGVEVTKNCEEREAGLILTHFKDTDGYAHFLFEKK